MATFAGTSLDDYIITTANGIDYRGGQGNDTYILTNLIPANATIVITDTEGVNKIQLADGLTITSSAFLADAVQLTLSNGAKIQITGASSFKYDIGANATAGDIAATPDATYAAFATTLGVATLPAAGVTTPAPGGAYTVAGGTTPTGAYTVSAAATSVNEGSSLTYTITAATAPTVDTSFTWAINASSTASAGDFTGATSGTAKILAGQTTATFSVTPLADNVAEFAENFVIDVKTSAGTAITSSPITTQINDVTLDLTAPVVTAAQTFTYAENKTAGYTVGTVAATDATGVTGYTIASGDTSNFFAIDNTGKLTLTAAGVAAGAATNDYETAPNTFTLGIVASDAAGNKSTATNVTVNVTNVDDDPPVLSTAIGSLTNLVLAYNETLDTASIPVKTDFYVTQTVGGTATAIDVSQVSISGSSVNLALSGSLTAGATVKVSYTPGTKPIQDVLGWDAASLVNQAVTTDSTAPTLSSSSPADNATNVAVGTDLVLTMSETVKAGTGNVTIVNSSSGTTVATIAITDTTQVTFSGTTVTINPTADLATATNYYVNIPDGAIVDTIGNKYAGITNSTSLNFSTPGSASTTGTTFTLTQGANTFTPTAAAPNTTTDGDDTFNAFLDGAVATFSPTLDIINGGGGTGDKLIAYGMGGATSLTNISNIEKFTFRATTAASFDMSTTTAGYTELTNEGSAVALDFLKIGSTTPTLVVQGTTADTAFVHNSTLLTGSTDSVSFQVNGVSPTAIKGLVLSPGIEILNFASNTSASGIYLITDDGVDGTLLGVEGSAGTDIASYNSATTLNITGNANLTLAGCTPGGVPAAAGLTGIKTVNAADFTGALSLNLLGNANNVTFTGGSGNDTLTIGVGLTADDVLNGGGGTNTLVATAAITAGQAAKVTNFQVLGLSGTVNQDMSLFPVTYIAVTAAASSSAPTAVLNNTTVYLNAATTDFTPTLATNTGSDAITFNIGSTAGGLTVAELSPDTRYETVTVNSQGSSANILTKVGTAVNNVNFTGSTGLTLTEATNVTGVLDFRAMTTGVTVGSAANTAVGSVTNQSVLTTNYADNVTIQNDGTAKTGVTVSTYDGNDTISISATTQLGATIDGGAGSDTITFTAAMDVASNIIVDGGDGVDFITVGATATTGTGVDHRISATNSLNADQIIGFVAAAGVTRSDISFKGALLNGTGTTSAEASAIAIASTTSLGADLSTVITANANSTVFIVGYNLAGDASTTLTNLVASTNATSFESYANTLEANLATALGTVANLDTSLGSTDKVLIAFDNNTDSVLAYVTNTDTSVTNTLTAAEIQVVGVFKSIAAFAATDFIA